MKAFMGNGNIRSFVCSASDAKPPREEDRPPTVHLPCVVCVSERLHRVCKDLKIRVRTSTSERWIGPDPPSVLSPLRSRNPSVW